MGLLFRNALKGLKRKKIQMFGIILLITLSTGIYVAMNTALDRLENKYYSYLDEQNVENISGTVLVDYNKDVTLDDLEYLEEHELSELSEEERDLFDLYKMNIEQENEEIDVNLLTNIEFLFNKYEANAYLERKKLEPLQDTYRFDFEYERSKVVMDNDFIMKVIPYDENKKMNKVYLREGHLPEKKSEITMLEKFAKANDLEIGDTFKINETDYKIVGYTYAPDYIYPLITLSTPIFDEKKNNIIFMYKEDYKDVVGIMDNTYALRFRDNPPRKFEITMEEEEEKEISIEEDPMGALFQKESSTIVMGVNTVSRIARTGALQLEFATNRLFADYFMYLLLTISVIIIMIVTKKRIEDERLQIGVLKSLGYSKYSIALSYLVYPILGSIIGGFLGFSIGSALNGVMAQMFLSYYNVPLNGFSIDILYLKDSIVIPLCILSCLSYLIALVMLRKKPLQLLKEGSNLKVNFLSKIVNFLTKPLPFKNRFKYSLASRSIGKLLIVTVTSFATGMLIVLTLIGMNLFNGMIESSFEGMKFDYMGYMNNYYVEKIDEEDDVILNLSFPLKEVQDKEGNKKDIKELDEEDTIGVIGLDKDAKMIELLNDKEESILDLLDENSIIVSKNMKEYLSLEIGDKIVFQNEEDTFTYTIVGFSNELMSFSSYVNREVLSHQLGYEEAVYNVIYSKNPKYKSLSKLSEEELQKIAYVMSFTDLKDNIMKQMDRFNTSIYVVIAFAAVMAFVIISVIASIIVEENKKTISLMKVMGYKSKEISSIVLNIYTPFVIFAYLLSIPAMISLLKWIVSQLVGDMQITIPISISFTHAMIGLIALLVAYYIAIFIAKRVLNKIPLAVALKRE